MIGSHVKWKGQWNGLLGKWTDSRDYPVGPFVLPGLQAYYDSSDTSSLVYDSAGRVSLFMDKSGNSQTNVLCLNGVAGNGASITALTAFRTGDFSVSWKGSVSATNVISPFLGGAASSFGLRLLNSNRIEVAKIATTSVMSPPAPSMTAFTDTVIGYTRISGTGRLYVNGVEILNGADAQDYTVGVSEIGSFTARATVQSGNTTWARVYSTGLTAPEMLADAQGTVQANCVLNQDFSTNAKLATSVTAATGQTVTINTSGATGARISGERDLYQGTVANQPIYLPWSGTNYGWLNATAGNYFSTPDSAAVSVTGDIEIIALAALADWTPAAAQTIVAKRLDSGNQISYVLRVLTGGTLYFSYSTDGTAGTVVNANSTAATGVADGATKWVKCSRNATTGDVRFDLSDDGVSWAQLGTTVSTAAGTMFDSTALFEVGAYNNGTSERLAGRVYYASVSGTIGGASAAVFNAASYSSGSTFAASTGETWTVNGGAHIVTRTGLYRDGVNDAMKSPAFPLAQPTTVLIIDEQVTWTNDDRFYDGNSATERMSLAQFGSSPNVLSYAGSSLAYLTDFVLRKAAAVFAVFNGATSILRTNRGPILSGNAGTQSANGFTWGYYSAGAAFANTFTSEVAVYSTALSPASQDALALYEGRKWRFTV